MSSAGADSLSSKSKDSEVSSADSEESAIGDACTLYEVATQKKRFPNAVGADKRLEADAAFLFTIALLLGEQQIAIGAPVIAPMQFTEVESITEEVAGEVSRWRGECVPLNN